jgi:hypothetical protein
LTHASSWLAGRYLDSALIFSKVIETGNKLTIE